MFGTVGTGRPHHAKQVWSRRDDAGFCRRDKEKDILNLCRGGAVFEPNRLTVR
jgi:hypothetical protein